jgi:hypothetical protein
MIVQRIVQEHGGQIEISSKPRAGTRFRIMLPLAERRPRMLKPSPATAAAHAEREQQPPAATAAANPRESH